MGHVPQPAGLNHPVYGVVRRLVDKGRAWVKLSVTYDNTKDGPPGYEDVSKVAQAYIQAAPERMVWGSNWPHPNEKKTPDDAVLFDLLAKWAPDEAMRNRILVRNPEALYGFNQPGELVRPRILRPVSRRRDLSLTMKEQTMPHSITRRETLRRGLTTASFLAMAELAIPARAAGEEDIPFTDIPKNFAPGSSTAPSRVLDIRKIDGLLTPREQFFAVQHIDRPAVDGASYRLKFTGMVTKPMEFSLADLRAMRPTELVAGYECSGNSPRSVQGLSSNGRWTGVRLNALLKEVGVEPQAREVIFFGADHRKDDIVFRQQTYKLDQQFGRSVTLENAMKHEPMVAWALNDEPLTREQGFPRG